MTISNIRPQKNDKSDVRCAFIRDRRGLHKLDKNPDDSWCSGCGFYVCEDCDSPHGAPWGDHDVAEHDPDGDEW